ncbi:spermatogenesis-associated protein 31E1-like [Ochotona princeps]|uniref:spermatogenesis-associated protein 31E1-like n=1 Tax=Ochotona princeps TaxID=9978 RepID=UPI002714E14D|nr:spermatogenesis-associated protein 31E1-like [Ochotona princeps]
MKRIPTGPVPENSPPRNSYLASLGTAIPGFDRLSSSISLFFWWWPTAKTLLLLTSPHGRCQQEHLSYHPPEASLWGDATHRQVEAGGPSFISPAVQELLEMSISKRVELMLKAEEKTGSLLNQRYPSYILRSLGTLLRSLSNKQAVTMPQPFWNLGNKPTQLLGPQHLSYSEVFGDDLEQKYSQLFWGLPSLHSESLVAAAWTPRKPSSAQVPSVLFNGGSSFCPVQTHANAAPQLSQAQLLPSSHEAQCQPLTQNLSLPLGQFHTQAHVPKEPTPSSPQIGVNKMPCSPSQEKTMTDSSLPIKNQQMEWPLQKRLKQRKALISLFKNPKEVAVQSTPHFPQGIQASRIDKTASTLPGDSISSQQEQLEQQSQVRLLTDEQDGPPCKFEDSQEETKPQGKCPQICHCQAMEKHDFSKPTRPWAYTGDPKVQESGFVCSKRPLSKAAGKVHQVTAKKDLDADDQEYLPWDSQGASVKVLEDHEEESKCGVTSPWECDCVNYKPKSPDKKHLKKALNVHLNKTLGQIKEGRIPVRVRRSWFVANHSLPKPNIPSKHRKLIFLKSRPLSVNTSRKLSFLNPLTRFLLETHLKRFDARYGWFLLEKAHEGTNLNAEAKQASSLSQCTLPLSAVCAAEANVRTKIASYLGGRPENETREQRVEQSGQITERLFCPASPEPIKVQRVLTMRPTACTCGFSVAPATRQEPRLPATELVTSTPLGRSQLGRTDQRAGSPEWRPRPMIARSEPQDKSCRAALANPCYSLERHKTKRGSQPTMAEDISQRGKAKGKSHTWGATVGASVMTDMQAIDMSLSLKPQGSRKHSHPPRTSAVCSAGQLGQRAQGSNELEGQTEVDSEKPPLRQVAGITQQKGTALTFPTTDILASQASWVASQSLSSGKTSAPQGLNDRLSNAMSDQGQQEARIPNNLGPRKSESKMFISPDKRSKPGELKERAAKKRVTIAGGMSHPTRDQKPEVMPFLPQKVLTPPDIHVQQTMRPSLQWFSPTPKGTEWKDTLERGTPASAAAQSHTPCLEKMVTERKEAEAQAIITAVAKVLINKLGLQQQPGPAQLHQQKKEPQAMLLGRSCLRSGSSYPEKKRVVIDPAFIKLTTPKGLSRSVKSRWIEKENKLVSSPRELVSPASPSQHRLTVTRISSWHVHCPSNCLLQQDVSFGQTHHASSAFLSGKSFTPEKGPFLQRKST